MLGVIVVILLSLVAIGGGVLVWMRAPRDVPKFVRALLALVPLGAAAVLYLMTWTFCNAPNLDWNGGKLAPILAMVKAEGPHDEDHLYHRPVDGVMTAWIYGPVPALMFLPAAIATRPTTAIFIALFINAMIFYLPALWAHLRIARTPVPPLDPHAPAVSAGWPFAMFVFLIYVWITMVNESMCRAALMIAPDGPTLSCAITSLMLLFYRRSVPILIASALCAALACWCKQSAIPFLLVAPVYLFLAEGALAAVSYLLILIIVGAITSTIFLLSFGPSTLKFHMVTLSASHGWENDHIMSRWTLFWRAVSLLLHECLPTLGLIAFTLFVRKFLLPARAVATATGTRVEQLAVWMRANPWSMFSIAALCLLPSSLLGFLKVGGYVNNFSLTHVFLALTASTLLIRLYAQIKSLLRREKTAPPLVMPVPPVMVRNLVLAALALLVMWDWPDVLFKSRRAAAMYPKIAHPYDNQQETIYEFAKANPGIVYFPWNTLSTLLAEKRLYHFEWGIQDRYAAGIKPSEEQILKHIPPGTRYVAFGPFHQGQATHLRWFSHWTTLVSDDRLKGFTIYTQPPEEIGK